MSWTIEDANERHMHAGVQTFLVGRQKYTVHVWVKRTGTIPGGLPHVLGQRGPNDSIRMLYDEPAEDDLIWEVNLNNLSMQAVSSGSGLVPIGDWWSVAGDFDTNRNPMVKLFVQGVNDGSAHSSIRVGDTIVSLDEPFFIGRRHSASTAYWEGLIGRFCIWSDTLSDQEHALLAAGVPFVFIRPDAFLFASWMQASSEFWVNYESKISGAFTLVNSPSFSADDPPIVDMLTVPEGGIPTPFVDPVGGWSSWSEIAQVAHPTVAYLDQAVTAGMEYEYRLRAEDNSGNLSGYSGTDTAIVQSGTPGPRPIVGPNLIDRLVPRAHRRRSRGPYRI